MKKELLVDIITGLLILLFVYTAVSKWLTYDSFKGVLQTAPLLRPFAATLAWAIPVSEIAVSFLLSLPCYRLLGLYASLGLMALFTLYLAFMLLYSPHLPCSCGGVISQFTWQEHLLFNLFFIAINGVAIKLNKPSLRSNILRNQA